MIAVFLLAILYEGIKTLREYLVFMDWRHSRQHKRRKTALRSIQENESEEEEEEEEKGRGEQAFILAKKRRKLPSRRKGYVRGGNKHV